MATSGASSESMSADTLKNIQWSQESLPLSQFVSRYPLPQIVQVEEGFDGGLDDNSLSAGQVLKIHTLTTERKVLCYDRHDKELHIPLHTPQKVILRPENYDTVYQRVADLSRARPIPHFVEVTRGYYNVDSNVNYELSVEPGEKLEVITDSTSLNLTRLSKKKFMTFKNMEGVEIKIPFDCVAGFKPLIDNKSHILTDVIPSETNNSTYPFHFEFVSENDSHKKLGVLKCMSSYDDKLIIASSGLGNVQVVFMIPRDLDVTVKVAVGTLTDDPHYENIKSSFHNFETIENDVQNSRVSQVFSTSSEISGFTYSPPPISKVAFNYSAWEKFEHTNESSSPQTSHPKQRYDQRAKSVDEATTLNVPIPRTNRSNSADQSEMAFHIGEFQTIASKAQPVEPSPEPLVPNPQAKLDKSDSSSSSEVEQAKVSGMSVFEICEGLKNIKMADNVVKMFEENQIDGDLFCQLDFEDFQEMGLRRLEIKKLFSFRDGWRPKLK